MERGTLNIELSAPHGTPSPPLQASNFAEGQGTSMATHKATKEAFQLNRRSHQSAEWQPLIWAAKVCE